MSETSKFFKRMANNQKAKGLGKLKFYCSACSKQCRDENGFQNHCTTAAHMAAMASFVSDPSAVLKDNSARFEDQFLDVLHTLFPNVAVKANTVYQEIVKDRHHVHMNSTKWAALGDFVKDAGKRGLFVVAEDELTGELLIKAVQKDKHLLFKSSAAASVRSGAEVLGTDGMDDVAKHLHNRKRLALEMAHAGVAALDHRGHDDVEADDSQHQDDDEGGGGGGGGGGGDGKDEMLKNRKSEGREKMPIRIELGKVARTETKAGPTTEPQRESGAQRREVASDRRSPCFLEDAGSCAVADVRTWVMEGMQVIVLSRVTVPTAQPGSEPVSVYRMQGKVVQVDAVKKAAAVKVSLDAHASAVVGKKNVALLVPFAELSQVQTMPGNRIMVGLGHHKGKAGVLKSIDVSHRTASVLFDGDQTQQLVSVPFGWFSKCA
eukprot:ANDGO_00871.mRNA.1 KIN17-like protein